MYPDGTVAVGVDVDDVLQGRRFPADAWATRQAAELACGDRVGAPGDWVEYASGRPLG